MPQSESDAAIGRIERMKDRFMNAGISIVAESDPIIREIRTCGSDERVLALEQELIEYCKTAYPIDRNKILATLNFYEQLYSHDDFMALHHIKC